jgi:hypothetical protein
MNKLLLTSAVALAVAMGSPALAKHASPLAALHTDNDGTVDLAEVNKAAEALFAKLEADNDGTVDAKELKGHLSKKELKAADPDNDGTLTKDEYLAAVGALFKAGRRRDARRERTRFETRQGPSSRHTLISAGA